MLLMIDNYDSFTYNLVHYFLELGQMVKVYRNDELDLQTITDLAPHYIVISPGPCTPNEAGISLAVIQQFCDKIPILGVCLGHQAIVQNFGGKIIRARAVVHGKTSAIYHNQLGVFAGLPIPFTATRYHSLLAEATTLPDCLEITAWTQTSHEKEIMGVKHKSLPVEGIQFHPESILTQGGHHLLNNFIQNYA